MAKKGPVSILFLTKNGFQFFSGGANAILSLNFPPETFLDMEVVSKENMHTSIYDFIEKKGLMPSEILVVFANEICFTKDISSLDSGSSRILQNFTSNVPFEKVEAKTYKTTKGFRMIGVNVAYYSAVTSAFLMKGFLVLSATPSLVVGAGEMSQLTADSARVLLRKKDLLKTFSMTKPSVTETKVAKPTKDVPKKSDKKRVTILISILGLGILILALLLISR